MIRHKYYFHYSCHDLDWPLEGARTRALSMVLTSFIISIVIAHYTLLNSVVCVYTEVFQDVLYFFQMYFKYC